MNAVGLLRRIGWLRALVHYLRRRFWRGEDPRWQGHLIRPLVRKMSRRRVLSFDATLRFEWIARSLLGQPLSLRAWHRMTLNDKVTYRRVRVRDPSFAVFSDKLAMREFVADRLGPDTLPELLEVADRAAAFAQRGGPFVLKANHGSGMVSFVQPGERLSAGELARADEWLGEDYAWVDLEWGYLDARRLLLAEEFLRGPGGGVAPPDFKTFVFDGSVAAIEVHVGRFDERYRIEMRRPDWSPLEPLGAAEQDADAPANLDVMLEWAELLGRDLDFVRVDLYDLGDRVLVGELTPYPAGGNSAYHPIGTDAWLGRTWRTKPAHVAPLLRGTHT
jgi:TupA-like ATPgrasp